VATTTYDYDGMGRLTDLTHGQGLTTLASYTYGFDSASRITSVDSLLDGFTSYSNDATGQLTGADHTGQSDESYSYDENGNRTMTGYVIDDNNRLTSDGTYTYEYDDEGNRTARETIATGERVEYQWDYRNRLTKIIFKDSTGTVTKTVDQSYDYLNRWIRREVDSDGAGPAAATDTFFSYLDGQIALEFDGSAASDLSHRYLWGPEIDQILADEQVMSLSTAGNTLWPLTDHLNTTRDIADRDATTGMVSIENHRQFDSYGNVISETDSTVDILFGFTARPVDEATGLQNNLHRWYDGLTGQWISEDPIGFVGGDENLKRYVGNRITNRKDPLGLAAFESIAELEGEFNKCPEAAKILTELKQKGLRIQIKKAPPTQPAGQDRAWYDPDNNIIYLDNTKINTLSGAVGYLLFEVMRAKYRSQQNALEAVSKPGCVKLAPGQRLCYTGHRKERFDGWQGCLDSYG
jgi:RHS repeat-associated protein